MTPINLTILIGHRGIKEPQGHFAHFNYLFDIMAAPKPGLHGIHPKISKPQHTRPPRNDLEVKFLNIIYTRVAYIVKFDLAPILKEFSSGRIWLRFMFAELNNAVPSLTLRTNNPFGVPCEVPYNVQIVDDGDADKVAYSKSRIEALLQYAYSYFYSLPPEGRRSLLQSKPIQIAQQRINNIRHLCNHLTHN